MTCRLRWYRPMVEIENRCRIPIRRTFGRIQWHVIPEPRITLRGAATWWIHCHVPRTTCHIAGCKNSIPHIENCFSPYFIYFLVFLMQFGLWRAAAFVSSSIHLFNSERFYTAKKNGPSETVRSNMSKLHNFKKRSVKWDVAVLFRLKWLFCCYWIQNCSENIFI